MKKTVLFTIPCYNEGENIIPLLKQFNDLYSFNKESFHLKVVVINDASTDDTLEKANSFKDEANFQYEIIDHEQNKGLTGGINTSFKTYFEEVEKDDSIVACGLLDGDNSHSPHHIPGMLQKLLSGCDIVICSRFQPGSRVVGVTYFRQMLSLGLAMIFKLFRNIPGVRDYSCGFRLYSPRIIRELKKKLPEDVVFEKSFASMVEVLVRCFLAGAVCAEYPMVLRYDMKLGESKMPFKKTILGNFKLLRTLKSVEEV